MPQQVLVLYGWDANDRTKLLGDPSLIIVPIYGTKNHSYHPLRMANEKEFFQWVFLPHSCIKRVFDLTF